MECVSVDRPVVRTGKAVNLIDDSGAQKFRGMKIFWRAQNILLSLEFLPAAVVYEKHHWRKTLDRQENCTHRITGKSADHDVPISIVRPIARMLA